MREISPNLPDFVVIGAMKCGTTSLQHYLAEHPDIHMAPKELNFFSRPSHWQRGTDWYQRHFPETEKIQGEISPGYAKSHLYGDIAGKMHSVIPNAKIIYLVRDPVDRLVSHFSHAIGADSDNRTKDRIFEESIENFVKTSSYKYQIDQYLRLYDADRILVITSESLKTNRKTALANMFGFLGVDAGFSAGSFDEVHHKSSVKVQRNPIGRLFARNASLSRIEGFAKSLVPKRLHPAFSRLLGRGFARPTLSDSQRTMLIERLQDDVAGLKSLTGLEFNEWKHFTGR